MINESRSLIVCQLNDLVNLTPHTINVALPSGEWVELPPSGPPARLEVDRQQVGRILIGEDTVPVYATVFGDCDGLPPPDNSHILIVSRVVAEHFPSRHDLIFPDEVIRNEKGVIIGLSSFGVVVAEQKQAEHF